MGRVREWGRGTFARDFLLRDELVACTLTVPTDHVHAIL
jgi:hypothetical protein